MILSGMLWIARTGASWRDLPEQFGPWQTIRSRYDRWRRGGIWQQILDALKQNPSDHVS
jgi:transposase